jgi:hypothetical protein
VPVPVQSPKCSVPTWPDAPDLLKCKKADNPDTCVYREIGLWIRGAEMYHDALINCPQVIEINPNTESN